MSRRLAITALLAVSIASADGGPPERGNTMQLATTAFEPGGSIPAKHTCDGEDVSPALAWSGAPEATGSFLLTMEDPDAPPGTWVHWVLFNVPGDASGLDEGIPKKRTLDDGSAHGASWGVSSFSRIGYHGPCPPPGGPHRYVFRLYALDTGLQLEAGATRDDVLRAAEGHVLARAELTGTYGR